MRRDIQGLRALAVVLVIFDHLMGKPSGGFIGVDVFFVVSGFVITGLLLREADSTGRISIRGFYARRVRRITPVAVVVLLATVAVGSVLLSAPRAGLLRQDAIWAALLGANWRSIFLGTDYLHATDAVSPLQHFWSLAVEEQFYLVWPAVVIVALLIARRRFRLVLTATSSVVIIVSFAMCLWETLETPTRAYFSTESRAWELGAGVLLACLTPLWQRLPTRWQTPLAWAGLIVIIGSALVLNSSSAFPAPGAVAPVLGAAAVLIAGVRSATPDLYPLTNRATNYVGDISYSLYIWHFPVIVFVGVLHPQLGHAYFVFSLTLIVGLAVMSFHLIEQPLRRRRPRAFVAPSLRSASRGKVVAVAMVAAVTITVACGAVTTRKALLPTAPSLASITLTENVTSEQQNRSAALDAALQDQAWPTLEPGLDALPDSRAPEWIRDGCLGDDLRSRGTPFDNAERCVYGDPQGAHTVAVLGDSVGISYLPGIRRALGSGWRIEVYTAQQCPAIDITVELGGGAPYPDCARFRPLVLDRLKAEHPDMIIATSSSDSLYRLADHAHGAAAEQEWADRTAVTLKQLKPVTDELVLLDGPPSMSLLTDCYAPGSTPASCVAPVEPGHLLMIAAQQQAVAAVGGVRYPSTLTWFCSQEGLCPAFTGHTPQTVDGRHLTAANSRSLSPLIREALTGS